jgi:type VI protein secretion system component VasF
MRNVLHHHQIIKQLLRSTAQPVLLLQLSYTCFSLQYRGWAVVLEQCTWE